MASNYKPRATNQTKQQSKTTPGPRLLLRFVKLGATMEGVLERDYELKIRKITTLGPDPEFVTMTRDGSDTQYAYRVGDTAATQAAMDQLREVLLPEPGFDALMIERRSILRREAEAKRCAGKEERIAVG